MTIFVYNIKRILKRRINIIFMIVVPILLLVLSMAMTNGGGTLDVGVVDNDNTRLTNMLIDNLEGKCSVVKMEEDEVKGNIISSSIDYAVVIDKGFTEGIIKGEDEKLRSYSIKETNKALPVRIYIKGFVNGARNIGKSALGDEKKFYAAMEEYQNGNFAAEYKTLDLKVFDKNTSLSSLGFLIMCIMFLSSFASSLILEDKKLNTYNRILSTPLKLGNYMLQNILSFIVIAALQIAAVLLAMKFIFNADLGPSIINLYIVLFVFGIVSVSIGIAISSLSKDTKQASTLTPFIIIPFSMLGGCFWPMEVMPDILKRIGDFIPTTWALRAAENVIGGSSILSLWKELGILLLFALVFFLLSSWRKTDIAK